jgi:hypothetical protein
MSTPLRLVEPQHLTGAALLDAVTTFLSRFIVFPNEHCAPTIALWFAHTHAAEHFYVTPRLVISSAEPGSGKTLVIEVGQYLVAKPEMVLHASTAAVFRMVAANGPISLLWDEVDAIFTLQTRRLHPALRWRQPQRPTLSGVLARRTGRTRRSHAGHHHHPRHHRPHAPQEAHRESRGVPGADRAARRGTTA